MNPLEIYLKYYPPESEAYRILYTHSRSVADKALSIARANPHLNLDMRFVEEAALLHDIGIWMCRAPSIDCHGESDYICHGTLGADLLRKEGLERHALVCERHTGSGITIEEIKVRNLPLPLREMLPVSLEEKLVCFADKFYSKTHLDRERTPDKIRTSLAKHGNDSVLRFEQMYKLFLGD